MSPIRISPQARHLGHSWPVRKDRLSFTISGLLKASETQTVLTFPRVKLFSRSSQQALMLPSQKISGEK